MLSEVQQQIGDIIIWFNSDDYVIKKVLAQLKRKAYNVLFNMEIKNRGPSDKHLVEFVKPQVLVITRR